MTCTRPLPREIDLLRCSARTVVDESRREHMAGLCAAGIDWDLFCELAGRHKLIPLIYVSLNRFCRDVLPASVLERLRSHFLRNMQRNLALLAESDRLLRRFKSAGLVAVPYKGLSVAAIYGGAGLRESGDIDLLVARCDMESVAILMREMGYEPDLPRTVADDRRLLGSPYNYHLAFEHPVSGIVVEPHWGLMPRFFSPRLDDFASDCLTRLTSQDVCGMPMPSLSASDVPLVLAVHGGKHLWERWVWICDFAEFMRGQPELNWREIWDRSRAIGVSRHLALALRLASDVLESPVPAPMADGVAAVHGVAGLARQVQARLCRHLDVAEPTALQRHMFILRCMDGTGDRASWIWHQTISSLR